VLDCFSRNIVGWSIKDTLHSDLCIEALEMALARRRPKVPLLHHSDRGSQSVGRPYHDKLAEFDLQCSMSRVGNCWDNAFMERAWASLKTELVKALLEPPGIPAAQNISNRPGSRAPKTSKNRGATVNSYRCCVAG